MDIQTSDLIRVISVVFAVLSVFPSLSLLVYLIKERGSLTNGAKLTNYILTGIVLFFIAIVFYNAVISITALFDTTGFLARNHWLINFRTLQLNLSIFIASVALNFLRNKKY